ncbi:Serine/threonine-protein kinase HT1 [Morella rubra]|uniref:Serine/threonine-protein kinase HT1 n=1 Tax=Morella rubra TaxID=262757 RepID=A0A6A1UTD3_9ROSI|nr:Serine/threonine-protein kinase HT1 [Morella rubra]
MGDTESCSSRPVDFAPTSTWKQRQKVDVYSQVLHRLKDSISADANLPGFEDELWAHFHRLPARYALDVNVERAEDVLMHKRLLHLARDPATRHAIEVRVVQVHSSTAGNYSDSFHPNSQREVDAECSNIPLTSLLSEIGLNIQETQAFSTVDGYSLDVFVVDGWALEETEQLRSTLVKEIPTIEHIYLDLISRGALQKHPWSKCHHVPTAEDQEQTGIKFSSNYVNFHGDGINGWEIDTSLLKYEMKITSASFYDLFKGTFCNQDVAIKVLRAEHINENMQKEFAQEVYIMSPSLIIYTSLKSQSSSCCSAENIPTKVVVLHVNILSVKAVKFEKIIGAIDPYAFAPPLGLEMWMTQIEIHYQICHLGNIRHNNVLQLIGACTRPPSLYLVTEYMSGGSMYDFLHKQKGVLTLPSLLRVTIDVAAGMNYLHQNSIIHRDLKAANLLMDGNGEYLTSCRVSYSHGLHPDNCFGLDMFWDTVLWFFESYVYMVDQTGISLGGGPIESPRLLIEHKPYDQKVDVFSFGVLLWELLTGKLPYEHLTPLQAAVGVVQKGLRPTIPSSTHPKLVELIERCWQQDPSSRPEFSQIVEILQLMAKRNLPMF